MNRAETSKRSSPVVEHFVSGYVDLLRLQKTANTPDYSYLDSPQPLREGDDERVYSPLNKLEDSHRVSHPALDAHRRRYTPVDRTTHPDDLHKQEKERRASDKILKEKLDSILKSGYIDEDALDSNTGEPIRRQLTPSERKRLEVELADLTRYTDNPVVFGRPAGLGGDAIYDANAKLYTAIKDAKEQAGPIVDRLKKADETLTGIADRLQRARDLVVDNAPTLGAVGGALSGAAALGGGSIAYDVIKERQPIRYKRALLLGLLGGTVGGIAGGVSGHYLKKTMGSDKEKNPKAT